MRKGIYNPFPVVDPKRIYDEAEAFYISANAIIDATNDLRLAPENVNKAILIQNAANVNHAFSFELYLKCLIAIESGISYHGHPLEELFAKVSVQSQNKIIAYHDNRTYYNTAILNFIQPHKNYDFLSLLRDHTTAFMDLRYLYERPKDITYELEYPLFAVKMVILELRPDFKN